MHVSDLYLEYQCALGWARKLRAGWIPRDMLGTYGDRLKMELDIFARAGISDYFLILQGIMNWCYEQNIPVGPGRGSAAGCLTSWLIDVTMVDPLVYGLLFERFYNPGRLETRELPDIDIDVSQENRDRIINEYIIPTYGSSNVAPIIAFGTLQPKGAIKDIGRALGIPVYDTEAMSSLLVVKRGKAMNIKETLADTDDDGNQTTNAKKLQAYKEKYPELFRWSELVEDQDLTRTKSVHASAIIICPEPIGNVVPLEWNASKKMACTGYDMHTDPTGLLKLDLLGLRNTDVLHNTMCRLGIQEKYRDVLSRIPLDDDYVWDQLSAGKAIGVFQMESRFMRSILIDVKPRDMEDLSAINALGRPGPLDAQIDITDDIVWDGDGEPDDRNMPEFLRKKRKTLKGDDERITMNMIEVYAARRAGALKVSYLHPKLEPILKNTQGTIIYQESCMEIAKQLAGYTLAEADGLRKAIGKKIPEKMAANHEKFVQGCVTNGIEEATAEAIWKQMETFAEYGFNKCTHPESLITLASGEKETVESLYKRNYRGDVVSYDLDTGACITKPVLNIWRRSVNQTHEIRLKNNDSIKTTPNHKFPTQRGIVYTKDLTENDFLMVPQRIEIKPRYSPTRNEAITLGCLLSEGNLCHPSAIYFCSFMDDELAYFKNVVEAGFTNTEVVYDIKKGSVHTRRINIKEPQGIYEFCREHKILNHKATSKFIPDYIKYADIDSLKYFVGALWTGDGCVNGSIYYASSSERMIDDLKFIMQRLGVVTSKHFKQYKYRGGLKDGWILTVIGKKSYDNFASHIAPFFFGEKARQWSEHGGRTHRYSGVYDGLPFSFLDEIRQEIMKTRYEFGEICKLAGISNRVLMKYADKNTISWWWLERLNAVLKSPKIDRWLNSDYTFMPIKSITPYQRTWVYDIEVGDTHNLVVDDIITMNSHSTAYSMLSYYTAYYKFRHPAAYMAALISSTDDIEQIKVWIEDARDTLGLEIEPPDVNESDAGFAARGNKLLFGLQQIKGVGSKAVNHLIKVRKIRPFTGLRDFYTRVDLGIIDAGVMRAVIAAGAFLRYGFNKPTMLELDAKIRTHRLSAATKIKTRADRIKKLEDMVAHPDTLDVPKKYKGDVDAYVAELRGEIATKQKETADLRNTDSWFTNMKALPDMRLEDSLAMEEEVLGCAVSGNIATPYKALIEAYATHTTSDVKDPDATGNYILCGVLSDIRTHMIKSGKNKGSEMVYGRLTDLKGVVEFVMFPTQYAKYSHLLIPGKLVQVKMRRMDDGESYNISVINDLEEVFQKQLRSARDKE